MRRRSQLLIVLILAPLSMSLHAETWRSSLVPQDWAPPEEVGGLDFRTSAFVQDFSYAGYHEGLDALPEVVGPLFDAVATYGADPSGGENSTAAIQAAIDAAGNAGGGVVWLAPGTYRLEVPSDKTWALEIRDPGVVLRGAGPQATFLANATTDMRGKEIIRLLPRKSGNWTLEESPPSPLTADYPGPTKSVQVASIDGFAAGQWIVLHNPATADFVNDLHMGPGADSLDWVRDRNELHGIRILRRITATDPSSKTIHLDAPTRWSLLTRDGAIAYRAREPLAEVGLENFSIGNQEHPGNGWSEGDYSQSATGAYAVHGATAIQLNNVANCWIRNIASFNPGNQSGAHLLSNGVVLYQCRGVTLQNISMGYPQYGGGGGNGYMFRLDSTNECLLVDSEARHCRHGIVMWQMETSGNVILRCYDHHTGEQRGAGIVTTTSGKGSDHHGYLSHANLFDSNRLEASYFEAAYRGDWGSAPHHGMTSAHTVYWNSEGISYYPGRDYIIHSQQGLYGYIIGTRGSADRIETGERRPNSAGRTAPLDWIEGEGHGDHLWPQSLYAFQLLRRMRAEGRPINFRLSLNDHQETVSWNLPPGLAALLEHSPDLKDWEDSVDSPTSSGAHNSNLEASRFFRLKLGP